jgi:hypothetical protein
VCERLFDIFWLFFLSFFLSHYTILALTSLTLSLSTCSHLISLIELK